MKSLLVSISLLTVLLLGFASCNDSTDNPVNPPAPSVGDKLWEHEMFSEDAGLVLSSQPFAIGSDGTVYYAGIGSASNGTPARIFAVNKSDGSLKWKTEPLETWHTNSHIVVGDNGTVYVMSYTKLYAIDPAGGSFQWIWEVPETLPLDGQDVNTYGEVAGLVLANNGDLIFKTNGSGSYYRAMYCVGPDGATRWYRFISASANPIAVGLGGMVYDFEYEDNTPYLFSIDPGDGSVVWKKAISFAEAPFTNIAITDYGDLIFSTSTDSLVCLIPEDGSMKWGKSVATNFSEKIINPIELLYLYEQGTQRAFYVKTGSEKESLSIGSPAVIDALGMFYSITGSALRAYAKNGGQLWEFPLPDGTTDYALTVSDDHVVYVGSGKKIYAIKASNNSSKIAWPCLTHDLRNTGNLNKR